MKSERKKRLSRFGFILGGILLMMNGVIALGQSQIAFGLIQIILAILNFAMLFNFIKLKSKLKMDDLIFILNSLIALIIAISYIKAGGEYIQYVWILTSIIYIVALLYKKRKAVVS